MNPKRSIGSHMHVLVDINFHNYKLFVVGEANLAHNNSPRLALFMAGLSHKRQQILLQRMIMPLDLSLDGYIK